MQFKFEDFVEDPWELPENAPLVDKFALLEKEVGDLKVRLSDAQANLKASKQTVLDWFQEHIGRCANDITDKLKSEVVMSAALKEHVQAVVEQAVGAAVEKALVEFGNELGKHIYSQVLKALKRGQ
jgi:hypothetical protein